jgi:hypothetical protein
MHTCLVTYFDSISSSIEILEYQLWTIFSHHTCTHIFCVYEVFFGQQKTTHYNKKTQHAKKIAFRVLNIKKRGISVLS